MVRSNIRFVIAGTASLAMLCGCDLFVSNATRVARADQAAADSNYGLAAVEYHNVLHSHPDDAAVRIKLVRVLLRSGDLNAATAEIEPLMKGTPSADAQDLRAQIYIARGDFTTLLSAFESGKLRLSPFDLELRKAQALLGLGRVEDAAAGFAAAQHLDPKNEEASIGTAQTLARLGHPDQALAALDALANAQPQASHAWLMRGLLQSRLGKQTDAKASLIKAQQTAKGQLSQAERIGLLTSLIEIDLSRSDLSAARQSLKELQGLSPNSIVTLLSSAQIDLAAGDISNASATLQKLLTAKPDLMPARLLLGRALLAQKNLEQADSHVSQLVSEAPQDMAARKLLAEIKLRQSNPSAALEALAPAAAGAPDPELNTLLGTAVAQASKSTEAIGRLETDLARAPADHELRLLLARVYMMASQAGKAVTLLRQDKEGTSEPRSAGLLLAAVVTSQSLPAAVTEAQKIAQANADNIRVLDTVTEFLISQHQFAPAGDVLKRALARNPRDASLLFAKAKLSIAGNDLTAATDSLQAIVTNDPANVPARVELARLALAQKNGPQAIAVLEDARAQSAGALEPRLMLAELYMQTGQPERTDKLNTEILAIAPDRAEVANALGELQLKAQRNAQALELFKHAASVQPSDASSWINVARAQLALNNIPAAREASDKSLQLKPDELGVLRLAALVDVRSGNKQAAVDRAVKYREAHPGQQTALLLDGEVRMELGQYGEAAAAFDEAYKKAPSSGIAIQSYRARVLGKLSDPTAPLDNWLSTHSTDMAARVALAEFYQASGQLPKAITEYERIVAAQPANTPARNNLAWLYQQTGNTKAQGMAKAAYDQAPGSPEVADTYGWILLERGNADEGLKILADAAARAPRQPDIQYHYASALARTGAKDEAVKRLTALLKDFPTFSSRTQAQDALNHLSEGTRSAT